MSAPLLAVAGLNAHYGRAQVLFDVALEVRAGEVVALMGRNGAGKSTTLKAIMGLLPDVSGQVEFMGQSIRGEPPYRLARRGLGYVPEERRIFTSLTVGENLEVGRQPPRRWPDGRAAPTWEPASLYERFPNLGTMGRRLAGRMSGGEQQMLTVARTLMGNPFLILLDEPSEGVAPLIVEEMIGMVETLKREGVSVLLSEQNLAFAACVADRAYVLEKGQIRHAGTIEELSGNEALRRAYLEL